ncbi:hypothetical protein DsansV1_C02g0015761 [Dioscorea sansibarensis]
MSKPSPSLQSTGDTEGDSASVVEGVGGWGVAKRLFGDGRHRFQYDFVHWSCDIG